MTYLEQYHEWTLDNDQDIHLSKRIVFAIVGDLRGRSGLDWGDIDLETQEEILKDLITVVNDELISSMKNLENLKPYTK